MRKKIAIVNQRYGLEVNGGSEVYARRLAERLAEGYEVEVLTTCAREYTTWANEYPAGTGALNGVTVRRFPVERQRSRLGFRLLSALVFAGDGVGNAALENRWIDAQGPYCPGLIDYIEGHQEEYDTFVFVTYLYYLTARGIGRVREKAVLIPTAHDEPYIRLHAYREVFTAPRAMIFLTEEERAFVHGMFDNDNIPYVVAGAGVEVPPDVEPERFRLKYGLSDYVIYVGRVDEAKNCAELFRYFLQYKARYPSALKLVLAGQAVMEIPGHPDIVPLGFVSEEDKYDAMAGAGALLLPSLFESLSLSALESMALGVPVLVNEGCAVLRGHCMRSGAGLYYRDGTEFAYALRFLLEEKETRQKMGEQAREYVREHYRWEGILERICGILG